MTSICKDCGFAFDKVCHCRKSDDFERENAAKRFIIKHGLSVLGCAYYDERKKEYILPRRMRENKKHKRR